jgi:hypothetical protein
VLVSELDIQPPGACERADQLNFDFSFRFFTIIPSYDRSGLDSYYRAPGRVIVLARRDYIPSIDYLF